MALALIVVALAGAALLPTIAYVESPPQSRKLISRSTAKRPAHTPPRYRDVVVDEARLAVMLARDELHELVNAYCRAVDRGDYAALRDLYHPDATDSHGSFSTGGVEQFIAQLQAAEPYVLVSQHNITTTNFTIEGATARGEIYCLVFHTFAGPEHDLDVIIGGRYLDKYTKHDGRWKFSQRTIVADWAYQNDPSQVNFEHPSTRGSLRGKPGQADPSIDLFT